MDQRLKCQTYNHKNGRRKHRQENLGHCLSNFSSHVFTQARETKEKMNKQNYIKLNIFCTVKEILNKVKRQPTEWENIFADTYDKGLISKTYKNLIKLNTKKINNPIKNGQRPVQTLLHGGHTDVQQTQKKMLNVNDHQRYAD